MDVKPFPVDDDVLARIRPMRPEDVPDVARLHHAAMGTSLWSRLGTPFLEALYRQLLRSRLFLGAVYLEDDGGGRSEVGDGRVRGFIAGTEDASRLFRSTFARRGYRLLPSAVRGAVRSPGLVVPLLETPAYFRRSAPADEVRAESLFCSFEPDLRGKRVSGHINKVLFDELLARGHDAVKITTETDNEGARRQLASWGFEPRGTFRFYGKEMITLVLDLRASPRVEPVRRWPR